MRDVGFEMRGRVNASIIDAHAHCGRQYRFPPQTLEDYLVHVRGSGIQGAVMFPPVMEVYDRHDPLFIDDARWQSRRKSANEYLLMAGGGDFEVIPFLFLWNDFAVEQLQPEHKGIKWHRHSDEPRYRYEDARCIAAIQEIRRRNMPVCLEEEPENTRRFINELAVGVRVIIPHCGLLNGGYERIRRMKLWDLPTVFTDTSLVPPPVIMDYLQRYGHERIMFGSDFPFGDPSSELQKILRLAIPDDAKGAIIGENIKRIIDGSNP